MRVSTAYGLLGSIMVIDLSNITNKLESLPFWILIYDKFILSDRVLICIEYFQAVRLIFSFFEQLVIDDFDIILILSDI